MIVFEQYADFNRFIMINFDTIRELREERKWTQETMADKLGLSRNGYAKIERGESIPSLERLDEIAKLLDVSVIELLTLNDRNVILQTQNQQANYYEKYVNNETLQNEIEKLHLIIEHQTELLRQKDENIHLLKTMLNLNTTSNNIDEPSADEQQISPLSFR